MLFDRVLVNPNPVVQACLAAFIPSLLCACANHYLDEAEALDIYRDSAPELLEITPGAADSDGGFDVSGLYLSDRNNFGVHSTSENSELLLRVKQHGNKITAFDSTFRLKLDGYVQGNRIDFYMYPSLIAGNSAVSGTWTIDSDGNLSGQWRTTVYGSIGTWSLRKLDDGGVEFYTTEAGMDEPVGLDEANVFFDRFFSRDRDKNIVFYLHGRGAKFSNLFDDDGIPSIEDYSETRFAIMRWLSWADITIRPYNHAVVSANGIADFLYAFNHYKSNFGDKIGDRKITLMAHSMGNIPLATFLQYRYQQGSLQSGLFDSIILNSADIPFTNHRHWLEKCDFAKRIYVTQHDRDYILKLSRYFFSSEEEKGSFRLGAGLDPEDESRHEQLASNASYLNLTNMTFVGHKHFTREGTLPLFNALLNARKLEYPDPSIGLYRKSARYPVFFFYSSEPVQVEATPD